MSQSMVIIVELDKNASPIFICQHDVYGSTVSIIWSVYRSCPYSTIFSYLGRYLKCHIHGVLENQCVSPLQ